MSDAYISFESLLDMLNSHDDENVILGLVMINGLNIEERFVTVACLYSQANLIMPMWREHAPEAFGSLRSMGLDMVESPIEAIDILKLMKGRQVPKEEIIVLMQYLAGTIKETMVEFGFSEIKNVRVNVDFK